jgi:hypothetical protein
VARTEQRRISPGAALVISSTISSSSASRQLVGHTVVLQVSILCCLLHGKKVLEALTVICNDSAGGMYYTHLVIYLVTLVLI